MGEAFGSYFWVYYSNYGKGDFITNKRLLNIKKTKRNGSACRLLGGASLSADQAVRGWRSHPQDASTATDAQMTIIASTCQVVRPWLKKTTARNAAMTGLRKKR